MTRTEHVVSEVLVAFRAGERMLADRYGELLRSEGWSDVTLEFGIGEWRASEAPDARSRLGFTGYVDGEVADVGGVAWMFDVIRDGNSWSIERGLYLNANTTDYQETVSELPLVTCGDSSELAEQLPALVAELLAIPAPQAPKQ